MGLLIAGGISLLLAVILFFVSRSKKKKLFSVQVASNASCGELAKTSKEVAEEIGAGSFNQYSKIYGKITVSKPLLSPFAERPCVFYQSTVYRKYESMETVTDDKGNRQQRRVTGEEQVSSESDQIPFLINDGTGVVEVSSEGPIREDLVETLNRFVPDEGSPTLSLGRFSLRVSDFGNASRTLGYRYQEWILPVDRQALVVGTVTDSSGALRMEKPKDPDYKFLITLKSGEEYIQSSKKSIRLTGIFSVIFAVAGVVLAALPFILKMPLK